MLEDGMSLGAFEMSLRWLYTNSRVYLKACNAEEMMELIAMANLLGLVSLVQVCEMELSKILSNYPRSVKTYFDFAER